MTRPASRQSPFSATIVRRRPRSLLSALLGLAGIAAVAWHCGTSQPEEANRQAVSAQQPPSAHPAATVVSDDPPVPQAEDTVLVFSALTGEWQSKALREAEPESEFLFQGKLFRLRGKAGLIEWVTSIDVSKLADADRTFQPGNYRAPEGTDVIYVVGKDARHVVLGAIQPGEKFAFQGRLFESKADPTGGGLLIQYTGNTLNRVAQTFKRKTDTLVDLTVRYEATGKDGVITGTPEHPFFVPAANNYVAMGKLQSGTQLRTSDGSNAVVLASNTRRGDFEVFNLEVENAHNYFVSPSGGGPGVLVHNSCSFQNLLPGELAQEQALAARVRARPFQVADKGFEGLVNEGRVKWVVTEKGELVFGPHTKNGVEISHAVLSKGGAVRAAGEADIVGMKGKFFATDVTNRSGHFMKGVESSKAIESLNLGVEAFRNAGIQVPASSVNPFIP